MLEERLAASPLFSSALLENGEEFSLGFLPED